MSTPTALPFALGTVSIAGCPPFAGLVIDEKIVAVQAFNAHADRLGGRIIGAETMLGLLEEWDRNRPLLHRAAAAYIDGPASAALRALAVPVSAVRIHAPIERPGQILMARANYRTHIIDLFAVNGGGKGDTLEERKADIGRMVDTIATEGSPFFFAKFPSAVTGPFDTIEIPARTKQLDWELELAVVIGRPARNVSRQDALGYVAGYLNANDISARDQLFRNDLGPGQDWTACKCAPGFMPMGPYLVPADFIADPHDLPMRLSLNGKVMQDEKTNDLIHDIPRLIEYASAHIQLWPGDIISTGSPAGNGMQIGVFIQPGDVIEAAVTGLGTMRNTFAAEQP